MFAKKVIIAFIFEIDGDNIYITIVLMNQDTTILF